MSFSNFNKAALTYDQHSPLQQQVGKKLISLLPKQHFNIIADIGCGTGKVTEALALSCTHQEIHLLDAAPDLLTLANSRISTAKSHLADFNFRTPLSQIDLIFSNMALHWSSDLPSTLSHLHHSLLSEGVLAFSIPLQGTFIELKNVFSMNEQPQIKDILNALNDLKFANLSYHQETLTYSFHSTLDALRSIRHVGATHVKQRNKSLLGKAALKKSSITQLTYEIGYFIARQAF